MFADRKRAETLLGWEPKVSLDEGLKITADWFRGYLRDARSAGA